jgi:hypothetical protein
MQLRMRTGQQDQLHHAHMARSPEAVKARARSPSADAGRVKPLTRQAVTIGRAHGHPNGFCGEAFSRGVINAARNADRATGSCRIQLSGVGAAVVPAPTRSTT